VIIFPSYLSNYLFQGANNLAVLFFKSSEVFFALLKSYINWGAKQKTARPSKINYKSFALPARYSATPAAFGFIPFFPLFQPAGQTSP